MGTFARELPDFLGLKQIEMLGPWRARQPPEESVCETSSEISSHCVSNTCCLRIYRLVTVREADDGEVSLRIFLFLCFFSVLRRIIFGSRRMRSIKRFGLIYFLA